MICQTTPHSVCNLRFSNLDNIKYCVYEYMCVRVLCSFVIHIITVVTCVCDSPQISYHIFVGLLARMQRTSYTGVLCASDKVSNLTPFFISLCYGDSKIHRSICATLFFQVDWHWYWLNIHMLYMLIKNVCMILWRARTSEQNMTRRLRLLYIWNALMKSVKEQNRIIRSKWGRLDFRIKVGLYRLRHHL